MRPKNQPKGKANAPASTMRMTGMPRRSRKSQMPNAAPKKPPYDERPGPVKRKRPSNMPLMPSHVSTNQCWL